SYHATRIGAEVAADGRLWAPSPWFAVHVQAAVAATRIVASGTYCADVDAKAIACSEDPAVNTFIDGNLSGVFPAATATLAFDFARRPNGFFHGARLAVLMAMGQMPLVRNGIKEATD